MKKGEKRKEKKEANWIEIKEWKICFNKFDSEKEKLREALCTLANGYIAIRGSMPYTSSKVSYKGSYAAGIYNRLRTKLKGVEVVNEDLVNLPDWTYFKFGFEDNQIEIDDQEILEFYQELDLKNGLLKRKIKFKDKKERITLIEEERIVSMADKHLAAIKIKILPINWQGSLWFCSGIDGSVRNLGVERYKQLVNKHLKILEKGKIKNKIYLVAQTNQSRILIVEALKQICNLKLKQKLKKEKEKIYEVYSVNISQTCPLVFEKILAFYTSKDRTTNDPLADSFEKLDEIKSFENIVEKSKKVWENLWRMADIEIEPKSQQQEILRFNLFHLLQVISKYLVESDAGIPARGLHGEAYRGHVFWDEVFIFPIICLHFPDLAREILKYRYRRLDQARLNAKKQGLKGALFPWQSASKGDEVTQQWHLNPLSGRWLKDNTYLQRHVNLAIAYNFWKYFEITHDHSFLYTYAAELIFEIARLMASLCNWNEKKQRWEIRGVMGPDEYHDKYPWSRRIGIDNNAYTNLLTVWLFSKALSLLKYLPKIEIEKIKRKVGLEANEIKLWKKIMKHLFVPFLNKYIIAQFEDYEKLKEFDWEIYRLKYGDIRRLDRILEAENDSTNNYKVSKQADALMLFYLFSTEELKELFALAGYKFDPKIIPATINYYLERTSHGSSLSFVVHSWVLSRLDRKGSWEFFTKTLDVDLKDLSKTTHEGIHLGAMAGSIDIIQRCYTGLEFRADRIFLNPLLPKELKRIRMKIYYRGGWLSLDIGKRKTLISFDAPKEIRIKINFKGRSYLIKPGKKIVLK